MSKYCRVFSFFFLLISVPIKLVFVINIQFHMFCQQAIHTAPHSIRDHWFSAQYMQSFEIHRLHWDRNSNPIHNLRWNWKLMNVKQQRQQTQSERSNKRRWNDQATVHMNERTNERTRQSTIQPTYHPKRTNDKSICMSNEIDTIRLECFMPSLWNANVSSSKSFTEKYAKMFRKWFYKFNSDVIIFSSVMC